MDEEDLRVWYQPPDLTDDDAMEDEEEKEPVEREVKAFWTLYIDILFISLDGNPFDAAWAAVVSALKNVRLPKTYWDPDREMILCEDSVAESKKLSLRGLPIAVTALVFMEKEREHAGEQKHWILMDPDTLEESLCDESITVVVDCSDGETKLSDISKTGGVAVGKEELKEIVALAEGRWTGLSLLLKG